MCMCVYHMDVMMCGMVIWGKRRAPYSDLTLAPPLDYTLATG